ncbi:MAG: hypothetical protein WBX25_03685 [Rhodomicrobium sp.]
MAYLPKDLARLIFKALERAPPSLTKARIGTTPLLMKTLPKVATEMALSVLAYNFTRVMNIIGIKPLMAAIAA